MYFVRGGVIALGVFALVYLPLSLLVAAGWGVLRSHRLNISAATAYLCRIFPLIGALAVVVLFAVPSFLWFEPRWDNEHMGTAILALAATGALILVLGVMNAVLAWLRTAQRVSSWVAESHTLESTAVVPAFQTPGPVPLVAVAGVYRPKLLVSGSARELLDRGELEAAIRHELAHIRHRDNLKKLMLRACAFPFMGALERTWIEAAEIKADDDAARDERSALDLASALLKVSRLSAGHPSPELATELICGAASAVTIRVERLLSWQGLPPPRRHLRPITVPAGAVAVMVAVLAYIPLLARVHQFTEMLVR